MKSYEEVSVHNMGRILNQRNLLLRTAKAFIEAIQNKPDSLITLAAARTFIELQDAIKNVEGDA